MTELIVSVTISLITGISSNFLYDLIRELLKSRNESENK